MIRQIIDRIKQTGAEAELPPSARPHYNPNKAFDLPHYTALTKAQLTHLSSLGIDFKGQSVLDVGSGIGRLSEIFDAAGCQVCCADGRPANIARLKELYPHRRAEVVDLEHEGLEQLGSFDIVFCYGLLYHVTDVAGLIRKCAAVTKSLFLLETAITPIAENMVRLVWENPKDVTQALSSWGSRPSPLYIETCLRLNGFEYLYAPVELPDHPHFKYKFVKNLSKFPASSYARDIFVVSRSPLNNPNLTVRDKTGKS